MSNNYFTEEEANKKIGKMVVTLREFSGIPFGMVGKVIGSWGDKTKFGLDIEWQFIHRKNHNTVDGFSKDEYTEFLREIE